MVTRPGREEGEEVAVWRTSDVAAKRPLISASLAGW